MSASAFVTLPAVVTFPHIRVGEFCRATFYASLMVFRPSDQPAFIEGLFRSRCPSAVAGGVALVNVDAINAAVSGSLAHIREKIRELMPAPANLNAARAVMFVTSAFRIVASSEHTSPRGVSGRAIMAVSEIISFCKEASARFGNSTLQAVTSGDQFIAADTSASPVIAAVRGSVRDSKDSKTRELSACDVNELGHGAYSTGNFQMFKLAQPPKNGPM